MKPNITEEQQFILVKKQVKKIHTFYKHLANYVIINGFLSAIFIAIDVKDGDTFIEALVNYHNYKIWFYWGIVIVYQAFITFGEKWFFSKDWEERKLNEYLNK